MASRTQQWLAKSILCRGTESPFVISLFGGVVDREELA